MNASNNGKFNKLSEEEKRILIDKGTEHPFSGEYDQHFAKGIYCCKQCDTPLFNSNDKFNSHCGWPSFDDALLDKVEQQLDADGLRTEIICKNCQGHLGHVFKGEAITPKNTRHCVNSLSLQFYSIETLFERAQKKDKRFGALVIAAGCFWGVEYHFQKANGVLLTEVGYSGGEKENPTYNEVCSGSTGHAEALRIVFDKTKTNDEQLLKLFFEIHNPTELNYQGPDRGEQYRSAIFYLNEEQKKISEELIDYLKKQGLGVVTQVKAFENFWPAEEYHQAYYTKKSGEPYCHRYTKRFDE